MVDSLQKTIQQLKAEVGRYKGRAHKAEQQLAKVSVCQLVTFNLVTGCWGACSVLPGSDQNWPPLGVSLPPLWYCQHRRMSFLPKYKFNFYTVHIHNYL